MAATSNGPHQSVGKSLWELAKHFFVGTAVFLLLAIPAIALDLFNQAVEVAEFDSSRFGGSNSVSESSGTAPNRPIRISDSVTKILRGIEYFVLFMDVGFVVLFLTNGLWTFSRSLVWK